MTMLRNRLSTLLPIYRQSNLPPGPKPLPILGNALPVGADQLGSTQRWRAQYGDLLRFVFPGVEVYLLTNPDGVREMLVSKASSYHKTARMRRALGISMGQGLLLSEDDFWKRQRRLAQPAFHSQRISAYADTMVQYTLDAIESWDDGQTRDVAADMMRLTQAIVAQTLFSANVSEQAEDAVQALEELLHIANHYFVAPLVSPYWLPTPRNLRARRHVKTIVEVLRPIIQQRRDSGEDQGDLLSMLLLARDEDGSAMSDQQVMDEAVTLFLAGHETTANALTWTFYLLAQHPEHLKRLHAEIDEVIQGERPSMEDMRRLPYLEMVLKESMRLYPPAWIIGRESLEEQELMGYRVNEKTNVMIPIFMLHREEAHWPEPERFDPERFTPQREKERHRYAYLPFGGGPRVCIGNQFAMMEAILVLATILQRYTIQPDTDLQVELEPLVTLRPRGPMPITLRRR
ncbi:MAG: cytochrome P450 [Chloroflexi bacterium]|nr:cytochrome P450 [Chloroflexota bacterium]